MWQRFRRRRVIRVVVAYAACSFAAVQGARLVLPYFTLPAWSTRAVWGAIVLGFPLTVVLAWTYDITPAGIVRTPDELGAESPEPTGGTTGWVTVTLVASAIGIIFRLLRI
jgi:hypothetical protein